MKQKNPFKHLLLLSILLAASLPAFSQHFDWVKTYTGAEVTSGVTTNQLLGSCVDSAGNLYILGEFSPQAQLCGESLLPMDVITTPLKRAVVVAKLSPSGELLWHKAIYNGKQSCYAYALRMVGDSSIMTMVSMGLPYDHGYNEYMNLYYLDTLLTGNDDYLMPTDSVSSNYYTTFITFDFDGNETERHIICKGLTDTNGNILTSRITHGIDFDKMSAQMLSSENFNIDADGNILVVRSVHEDYINGRYCDTCEGGYYYWGIDKGTIGSIMIVVDGTHTLTYPVLYPTALWNQQIIKFSPHFDSLIGAIYIFDSALTHRSRPTIKVHSFNIDKYNNLYINMSGVMIPSELRIANSNSLDLGDTTIGLCWALRYNSDLFATSLIKLSYFGDCPDYPQINITDNYIGDTNSVFVSGYTDWISSNVVNGIIYQNDTIAIPNKSGFWLQLNKNDLSLLSYGLAKPGDNGKVTYPHIATKNNRVFSQISFLGNITFGDSIIYASRSSDYDKAFAIWDYDGHELMLKKYNMSNVNNLVNSPNIIDSIVYLTGSIWEDATFGDITTQNYGSSQVFIAKYVDPAFAEPYVHPSDRQEQMIEWQQDLVFTLADSPVTLTATATSGLPVSYTSSDSTIAYVEGDRLHLVADGYAWLTATQEGDYQYFPAEPVQRLLTVGNVGIATVGADGQAKAYPNPTSGRVTLDLAKIPPAPPLPYHRPRPSDTSDVDMVLYTSPRAPFSQTESANFPYHQRYNMKVNGPKLQSHDGIVTAWLTDMQGRREEVVLTPTGPDRYTLDLTSRPPAAYLLTVTTADGRELTFRLMKQYGRK